MTIPNWIMPERIRITTTGMDKRDLDTRRNELRHFMKELMEVRGTAASSKAPELIDSDTDPERICRWTYRNQAVSIDHTTYGSSSRLNLGSNGTLILRIDDVRFDKPLERIVAIDLIDAMIAGIRLVTGCMDLSPDDPRIDTNGNGQEIALGWALTVRERRITDGGDPNEAVDVRCQTPWSGAQCVSYPETDDAGVGRVVAHRPEEEPRATMLEIRHTALASVLRPTSALVADRQYPLIGLRAITAYRSSLT